LAILHKKNNLLEIWEVPNNSIEDLFEILRGDNPEPLLRIQDNDDFKKTKNLEFDSMSKYLVCFGIKSLNIVNLEDKSAEIYHYSIKSSEYFRAILDVQLVSDYEGFDNYRCDIACRAEGSKSIILFTIGEDEKTVFE
jgi:hypothetical protein